MKKLNIIFLLPIFLVFFSCEEEIKFTGVQLKEKLVVNGIIAADSAVIAQVTHSSSMLYSKNKKNYVNNAQVKLYENDQFVGLLTVDTLQIRSYTGSEPAYQYTLKGFKATSGNLYKLEVDAPNFESVATHTTIPKPVDIERIDTTRSTNRDSWGGQMEAINFAITFNDSPSEKNYYRIVILNKIGRVDGYDRNEDYSSLDSIAIREYMVFVESNDLSINPNGGHNDSMFSNDGTNRSVVFNDELFNGKNHTITVYTPDLKPRYHKKEFTEYIIQLHSISKEYYLYSKSLGMYESNDGDPFSEPVQVYSNVENGYGIFGAYSYAKKSVLDGVYPDESVTYYYPFSY